MPEEVAYVTSGWGVHDDRWMSALDAVGFTPLAVSIDPAISNPAGIQDEVLRRVTEGMIILAGPLDTITRHLIGLANPVIGLSWGFDVFALDRASDLAWLRNLTGIIVDSPHTAALCSEAGVSPSRITLIPWGVDLDRFTPEGTRADLAGLGLSKDAQVILTARRHEPMYRVADVIAAMPAIVSKIPNVHLIVANTGSLTGDLRAQGADLGVQDRVHFIGQVSEDELADYLRSVDVYVSASEVDGSSVTLLQAMATGTRIVASNIPGNRAWLASPEAGWLFEFGQPASLARELHGALTTPHTHRQVQARELVLQKADWKRNIGQLRLALT